MSKIEIEPMLSKSDVAALTGYSVRKLERDIAAGRLPKPDLKLGRMPRWRRATIDKWITTARPN